MFYKGKHLALKQDIIQIFQMCCMFFDVQSPVTHQGISLDIFISTWRGSVLIHPQYPNWRLLRMNHVVARGSPCYLYFIPLLSLHYSQNFDIIDATELTWVERVLYIQWKWKYHIILLLHAKHLSELSMYPFIISAQIFRNKINKRDL